MGPNRIDDDNAARYSCDYRHIGERMALLTVELRTEDPAPPADARLQIGTAEFAPAATAVHPAAGLARLAFVVGRDEEAYGRTSLSLALGADAERGVLPPPIRRAPVSAPDGDVDEVVASVLNGEQLL